MYPHVRLLKCLLSHNIFPTQQSATFAVEHRHIHVLKFLLKHRIFPTEHDIGVAKIKGYKDIVELAVEYGISMSPSRQNRVSSNENWCYYDSDDDWSCCKPNHNRSQKNRVSSNENWCYYNFDDDWSIW